MRQRENTCSGTCPVKPLRGVGREVGAANPMGVGVGVELTLVVRPWGLGLKPTVHRGERPGDRRHLTHNTSSTVAQETMIGAVV